jgi:hypothetical protein
MAFASVSTALLLQKGHIEGLATFSSNPDSYMFLLFHGGSMMNRTSVQE